jgi:hypothetical protein
VNESEVRTALDQLGIDSLERIAARASELAKQRRTERNAGKFRFAKAMNNTIGISVRRGAFTVYFSNGEQPEIRVSAQELLSQLSALRSSERGMLETTHYRLVLEMHEGKREDATVRLYLAQRHLHRSDLIITRYTDLVAAAYFASTADYDD